VNFDLVIFCIFILLITVFLIFKRKKVEIQKIIFPVLYVIIYRTSFGLKFIEKISSRYRELVKTLGYCFIGFGFVGMIWVSLSILLSMISFFIAPKTTEVGMVLVLPGTNIPGIGYLSFFYFIISISFLALVHEFGHGILIRAHNLVLKSSGFAFFSIFLPIIPAAFVEPDEKKMSKKESHIQYSILSAGPITNVLFSIFFLLILMFVMAPIEEKITEPTGFSFDVMPNYPAAIAGLVNGTVLDSFNGAKVNDSQNFLEQLRYCSKPNEKVTVGNPNNTYEMTTTSNPDNSEKAFIGVSNIKNEAKVKKEYERFGGIFFWLKGLFKWLYLLNLLIGLVNLLPIYITDGAKMLFVALQDIIKDKKRALKIWSVINLMFVLLVLIGTSATYLKKFGLF